MPYANTRFHAVGQGCFYSGEIYCDAGREPFRIVYDCGTETGGDALEREVTIYQRHIHDAPLDMLVLSHLDADHVNGLSLLLDNALIVRNVFLPYLSPVQRMIAAAGAGDEADPNYFELLADPVGFLEGRGVENIIFVGGGEDDSARSSGDNDLPFRPSDEDGDAPNLDDLEMDSEGKMRFEKGEARESSKSGGRPTPEVLPCGEPGTEGESATAPTKKANLFFKTDRRPFRLTRCWQGKFFHRDDMRLPIVSICASLDFTIQTTDSASVRRYKRFLRDVHNNFGTLDAGRLVRAIRNEAERVTLQTCYHHIRSNHNDVSLVLWHGPIPERARAQLTSSASTIRPRQLDLFDERNRGTLLTGDLTCEDTVMINMERHFGRRLTDTAFLQVPHHGSMHSWNTRLLTGPNVIPIISAGTRNPYRHPHNDVLQDLNRDGRHGRWAFCNEHNNVAMHIRTT